MFRFAVSVIGIQDWSLYTEDSASRYEAWINEYQTSIQSLFFCQPSLWAFVLFRTFHEKKEEKNPPCPADMCQNSFVLWILW